MLNNKNFYYQAFRVAAHSTVTAWHSPLKVNLYNRFKMLRQGLTGPLSGRASFVKQLF